MKEIRLPAPHPRLRPRIEAGLRKPGHPGTAVRIGEELFEVVSAEKTGGEWIYGLEPWTGEATIRVLVDWGEDAEREFLAGLRQDRARERKTLLAWAGQAFLGFLPARRQERLAQTIGLDPPRATFWSAVLETAAALLVAGLFIIGLIAGAAGGPGGGIPNWLGALALAAAAEGAFRLAASVSTGAPMGSLFLVFLDLRLKDKSPKPVPTDKITTIGDVLEVASSVPKAWWERDGGVTYQGEPYTLAGFGRDRRRYTYRFRRGGEGFPVLDPRLEEARNRSSDLSYVLAPLWGFLPASLQHSLEFYGRYKPRPYVILSVVLNSLTALALAGPGIKDISLGVFRVASLLPLAAALALFLECVLRLLRVLRNGQITGSVIDFIIKPLYHAAIRDHPRRP